MQPQHQLQQNRKGTNDEVEEVHAGDLVGTEARPAALGGDVVNGAERPARNQLVTARMRVAQFEAQIAEFDGLNREGRRTPRGRDLEARIDGLRQGHAKWVARVAELEQIVATESGVSREQEER